MSEYNTDEIIKKIGISAVLEQLAEEAAELAQAALKMARIIRRDNPTPVKFDEAFDNLIEEYSDVCRCAEVAGIKKSNDITLRKLERWKKRIMER